MAPKKTAAKKTTAKPRPKIGDLRKQITNLQNSMVCVTSDRNFLREDNAKLTRRIERWSLREGTPYAVTASRDHTNPAIVAARVGFLEQQVTSLEHELVEARRHPQDAAAVRMENNSLIEENKDLLREITTLEAELRQTPAIDASCDGADGSGEAILAIFAGRPSWWQRAIQYLQRKLLP